MTTRRGFFKSLLGVATAPATLGALTIGIDKANGEDYSAFNFTCACGHGLTARVPKEIGEKITLDCDCGLRWEMEWAGGCFKTKMLNPSAENKAFDDDAADWAEANKRAAEAVKGQEATRYTGWKS